MKALLDSGVWWRRYHRLPLSGELMRCLSGVTEWWLSPLSVAEMLFKWRHKPAMLPAPAPDGWLENSLQGFRLAHLSVEAARLAGLWDWSHGDPVDRCLAAIARAEGLTLIHTDARLKDLAGFPQRYFKAVA
jgi:PIN domain nuclease of toxin-antitoxin system